MTESAVDSFKTETIRDRRRAVPEEPRWLGMYPADMFKRAVVVSSALMLAIAAGPSTATAATCDRFVVGEANSTAYDDGELPARGTTRDAACATLRGIARRMQQGDYKLPSGAIRAGEYGRPFTPRYGGKKWRCRVKWEGASGPTYRVRCTRPSGARLVWKVG